MGAISRDKILSKDTLEMAFKMIDKVYNWLKFFYKFW